MVVWESPSSFAVVGESLSPLPATGHYDFEEVSFVRFSIILRWMSFSTRAITYFSARYLIGLKMIQVCCKFLKCKLD